MIFRAIVLAAAVAVGAGAGAAHAQVLDANDPAVTERPFIRQSTREPSLPKGEKTVREYGEVGLTVCVDVAGNIVAADMSRSSGHQLLDEATLAWVRSGLSFKPALTGNKPVAVCNYVFTYVWNRDGKKDATKGYLTWSDLKPEERPSIATQVNGPIYPPKAVSGRIEGAVRLSLCITPFGRVVSSTAIEGDKDSGLVAATSNWIGRFTFNPGQKDGAPVGVCGFPVKYDWKLPN